MLAIFAVLLGPLRRLPTHEYVQLERAPAWLTVVVGGGILLISLLALRQLQAQEAQVFIGLHRRGALLMADAYSLWGSALLGAVLAVAAWVPAARRSLLPKAIPCFLLVLVLAWCSLLLLFSVQIGVTLVSWLLLLAGVLMLWALLFRPGWRWEQLEVFVLLSLAGILGGIGLLWLRTLTQGYDLTNMWNALLTVSPRAVNGVILLLAIAWLGPAVYLPWWLWARRDAATTVWIPASLCLSVAGVLAFTRVLFFVFPAGGGDITQLPGVEHLYMVKHILHWMLAWGFFSLLLGAGWLVYASVRRVTPTAMFRPIVLLASGLLLLGIAGGALGLTGEQQQTVRSAMTGMLWIIPTWAGAITVWLAVGNLLPQLTHHERSERIVLYGALGMATAALLAVPPTTGFYGIRTLWSSWGQFGASPAIILISLLVALCCIGWQLPRYLSTQVAASSHPGTGWGVIGPFAFAFVLLAAGVLAGPLAPLFSLIRISLLQAY